MKIIDLQFQGIPGAIAAFLLESTQGPVLIETGPHSTLPQLESSLQQSGYELADVQHVLLTHIHFDHAGAAWAFAQNGASIYVHPKGLPHLNQPDKLIASATQIYGEEMDRLWGQIKPVPEIKLQAVAHEAIINIGDLSIRALHTPGHASHHIAWVLDDQIFTGDVAGVKIGNGPVVPPCPPPDINLEDWKRSIGMLRAEEPSRLWLTHFGAIDAVENHLNHLDAELQAWANWIKPHYLQGHREQEITADFQLFVRERLRQRGVDNQGLEQYEAANPSWMSVAGLLRYWHKRLRP